jgi:hypothetical protein
MRLNICVSDPAELVCMNFPNLRPAARHCLFLTLLCGAAPAFAEPLSEAEAIRRALALPEVSALDSAERDAAEASVQAQRATADRRPCR